MDRRADWDSRGTRVEPMNRLRQLRAGIPECYTICITMRFEWDSKKNRINQTKYNGLDFETAARVFDDPNVVLMHDRVIDGEQRWHAIRGRLGGPPAGRAYIQ